MAIIDIEYQNNIALVYLNRPEKKNAMSFELLAQLISTAKLLKKNKDIRAVILLGKNHTFSSGIDLNDLNNPKNAAFAIFSLLKPTQNLFQKAFLIWQTLPVPVICCLESYCYGAGMQLALAADIRIAHPETKLSIMESRWGLVPDMGLSRSIKDLAGIDAVKELTFSGRIFDAEYAKSIGLISHVEEQPLAKALELAAEFSQRSPDAVLAAKRVLHSMQYQPKCSLFHERIWQLKLLASKNRKLALKKEKNAAINYQPRQYR